MADYGHWLVPTDFEVDDWFGFVYRITNNVTGRQYIGKKQLHTYTRKKVKGRKNRKKVVKEMPKWREYTGSSKQLNDDIEALGKENFTFQIESLHKTRASLYYEEVQKQVFENCLREKFDNGERKYYNGQIAGIKFIPPDEVTEETKAKISRTMIANGTTAGENNPRYGKHPHEKLNEDELADLKSRMSHPGEKNPMHGKPCYYNMTEEEKQRWKNNISKGTTGITNKHSEEGLKRIAEARSGPQKHVKCPHCDKAGGVSNMKRYHFDNCKNA